GGGVEADRVARAQRTFLRLSRVAEADSGQLQRREPINGDEGPGACAQSRAAGARRRGIEQAVAVGAGDGGPRVEHALQREARDSAHDELSRYGWECGSGSRDLSRGGDAGAVDRGFAYRTRGEAN